MFLVVIFKSGNELQSLVHLGSEFQTTGAAELKARVRLLLRVRGTTNCVVSEADRNRRGDRNRFSESSFTQWVKIDSQSKNPLDLFKIFRVWQVMN